MENDFYNRFSSIIKECNYDNTYKMAWAKAIVEICCERSDGTSNLEISLFDIAQKFIKYYWNQTWFFDYKQSDNSKRPPAVISLVKDLIKEYKNKLCINCGLNFHSIVPIEFEKAQKDFNNYGFNEIYHKYISKIVSVLKFNVSWRFDSFANTANQLYSYSKKADFLIIKKEDVQIIKENSFDFMTIILIRWALIIKNFNSSSKTKKIIVPYNFIFQELKNNIFEELLIFENEQLKTFINTKYVSINDNLDNKLPKIVEDWIEFIESENFVKPQTFKFAYIISILDEIKNSQYVKKSGLLSIPFIYHSIFEKYWKPLFEYKFIQTESNDNNFLYDNVYNYFKDCLLPKHSTYTFGHFLYVNHHLYHFLEIKPDKITHEFSNLGLLEYKNLWVTKQSSYMHNNFVVKTLDLYFNEEQLYVLGQYNNLLQKLAYYKWAQLLAKFNKICNFSEHEFYDDYINFKTNLINTFFASKRLSSNKTRTNEINNIEDIYLLISSSSLYRNIKVNNIFENNKNVTSIPRISKTKQVMLQNEHDNENFKTLDNFINNNENENFVNNKIKEESSIKSKQCNNIFYKINDDGNIVYSNYSFDDIDSSEIKHGEFLKINYLSSCEPDDKIIITSNIFKLECLYEILGTLPVKLEFLDECKFSLYEELDPEQFKLIKSEKYINIVKKYNFINTQIKISIKGDSNSLYWLYLYIVDVFSCFNDISFKINLKKEINLSIQNIKPYIKDVNLLRLFENDYNLINQFKNMNFNNLEDLQNLNVFDFDLEKFKFIKNRVEWLIDNEPIKIVNEIFDTLEPSEVYIMKSRYFSDKGVKSLEELANDLSLTRQRIQQIESKLIDKLRLPSRRNKLIKIYSYIYLFSFNDYYVSTNIFRKFNLKNLNSLFCKVLNEDLSIAAKVFIDDTKIVNQLSSLISVQAIKSLFDDYNTDLFREFYDILNSCPNIIYIEDLKDILKDIHSNISGAIDFEDLKLFVKKFYYDYGSVISRTRLTEGEVIKILVSIYFPNGVQIYEERSLDIIRSLLFQEFNIDTDLSNHSLSSKIARECLLYDKGTYFYTNKKIIPIELAQEIYQFMIDNKKDSYFDALLFSTFEKKLSEVGVKNRYLMKSALRQYYEDVLVFSKDYIGFNSNRILIYDEIEDYIKGYGKCVYIEDIKYKFPGVSDSIITNVISRKNIINYRSKVIHVENLNIEISERQFLHDNLRMFLSDGSIHHVNDFYVYLNMLNPGLLNKLEVEDGFSLFSLLYTCFSSIYSFKRPFIANLGIVIENQKDRIKNYVKNYEEIKIQELLNYLYNNNLRIYSILQFIDELDDYVLKDDSTIISLSKTNLNKYNYEQFERILDKQFGLNDFVFADNLKNTYLFPNEVNWTSWLIYSAINKFSSRYKVIPSSNKFKIQSSILARPVIIKKDVNANNIDEFILCLKSKTNMNDDEFYVYLKQFELI